jgi:hypothetical protein
LCLRAARDTYLSMSACALRTRSLFKKWGRMDGDELLIAHAPMKERYRDGPTPLGPARSFVHVLEDRRNGARLEGETRWEGGTRVPHGSDSHDGVFAGWWWNGERLTAYTDRLGFYPLFLWSEPTRCCISPSVAVLLEQGAPRDLDLDAIGVFLRLGYFLGDDTPFRAIRAIPPVRRLTWCRGVVTMDEWDRPTDELSLTREEAIEGYVERFRASVARRLPAPGQPFALPLSGGADSRHILFELARQKRPPNAAITATRRPGANDVEVAAQLCARLRIPLTRVWGPDDAGWSAELRKNRLTSFCADEHVWYLPVAEQIVSFSDLTYDGIGPDVRQDPERSPLGQVDLRRPVRRRMRENRIDELLAGALPGNHHEDVLAAALRPSFLARVPAAAVRDRVADELTRHLDRPNAWASYYQRNNKRRELSLMAHSILGRLTVHTPYADRDVFEYLSALRPELLVGRQLHVDTIRRAFPEYADIPFAPEVPRPPLLALADLYRRVPHRVAVQLGLALRSRHSQLLSFLPPAVHRPGRHPLRGISRGINRRLLWLRHVELVANGELEP